MGGFTSKNKVIPLENNSYYVGNVRKINYKEVIDGKGILVDEYGNKYCGNFKKGKYNGYGELYYQNIGENIVYPIYYKGYWKNDFKHGKGFMIYSDGSSYQGKFYFNELNNYGKYTHPDGSYYLGNFSNGFQSGKGKLFTIDHKLIYHGEWFMNQYHGFGTLFNPVNNKKIYQGLWKHNLYHGSGKFYNKGIITKNGIFVNGN
jgi:hypothetical protein